MICHPQDVTALTNELHKLDSSLNVDGRPALEIRNEIISKAKDLIAALTEVEDHVWQRTVNAMEIGCIRILQRLGVLEALPENASIGLAELATKTHVQEALLERYLRLLVGTKFLHQHNDGSYGHTRFSAGYLGEAGDFFSSAGHDIGLQAHVRYHDFLDAHPDLPIQEDGDKGNTFAWMLGGNKQSTATDVIATRPDFMSRCQRGLGMIQSEDAATGSYPFGELSGEPDRVALVDVGGGAGQSLIPILEKFPELDPASAVLQDRAEVIEIAKTNAKLPEQVTKMVHDFNKPQPVKNAKAYHMRFIMHDYPDEACVQILTQLRDAMGQDSKLLIADMIVPERVDEGSLLCAALDMVLLHTGGKERTVSGFEKILRASGLKLKAVWSAPNSLHQGIVEAVLA